MRSRVCIKSALSILGVMLLYTSTVNAQLMGDIFPSTGSSTQQQSGPTEITSNSMDIDLKGDTISLFGNVKVNSSDTKITADEIVVYLEEDKAKTEDKAKPEDKASKTDEKGKKVAKKLIAIGNVVIIKKSKTGQEKNKERATAGRADYDIKTGEIVLTDDPVLFQEDSYIKGERITLFRDSDRVKIEGNQSMGQESKLIYNPKKENSTLTED